MIFKRLSAIIGLCLLAGCGQPKVAYLNNLELFAPAEKAWQASIDELKGRGFQLDRLDRREGLIETMPKMSREWYELGGGDVVTGRDLAESSLNTLRRQVAIEVIPGPTDSTRLVCRVRVDRQETIESPVRGNIPARNLNRPPSGRYANPEIWQELGPDPALADAILKGIARRCR